MYLYKKRNSVMPTPCLSFRLSNKLNSRGGVL
nr:MAG TPA: hypothetical protein [Caudoviricetes sp.]